MTLRVWPPWFPAGSGIRNSRFGPARPEHAEWQGKIYPRSGKSEKYPDFRQATGYGTGTGLCGWNCRHTFGPYIEGSPRVWTDEKLEELSAPKYEYQGEKFTEYEARQKEKYFDRQITRWRREAEAMKAASQDPAEARAKVKAWERRKSDFVLNREQIFDVSEREREKQWGVQYGKSAIVADKAYINSDSYAGKFKGLTGSYEADQAICEAGKKAVHDNSGTFLENMYLFDANTGERLGAIEKPEDKIPAAVSYTADFKAALSKAIMSEKQIIALHNHPEGTPPSAYDFNKALDNHYLFGIICGANGQVYRYYPPKAKISNPDAVHQEIVWRINQGIDVDRAYRDVLKYYYAEYDILSEG